MTTEWLCIIKEREANKKYFPYKEVFDHPLKVTSTVTETRSLNKIGGQRKISSSATSSVSSESFNLALDGLDPLSHFIEQDRSIDPLSLLAAEYESDNKANESKFQDTPVSESVAIVKSWAKYRSSMLAKFTTAEKLTIISSFLSGGEIIKTQTTMSEKVKCRLDQLDDFEDGSVLKMMDLTQQEYQIRIEQLNHELVQAWNTDQRVRALKIAIQCSKMLADTSVMHFYPSQFVFITDILDIFGNLVYIRLRTKAEYIAPGTEVAKELPENFTTEMVPEAVKETCLNWFYKIASIRELLPRLYLEIALLKSYSFLNQAEFNEALLRLTRIIRGIGDPLVAAYARCYLVRVGLTVTNDRDFIMENLNDFLFVYQTMFSGGMRAELSHQRIDMAMYLRMYEPAINWIMQSLSTSSHTVLDNIFEKCKEKRNSALLFSSILSTFNASYISTRANQFLDVISSIQIDGITKGELLRSLGKRISICPPAEDQRLGLFLEAWKTIGTITNATEYIRSVEPWIEYVSLYTSATEVNVLMESIITRMNCNRNFELHYVELQSICTKLIDSTKNREALLISEHFLPLLDLLQKESIRLDICKHIMTVFKNSRSPAEYCRDPVLTNALMYICKILNDTTNAFSGEDERRQISELISYFIQIVNYDKDFEKQLAFYVEARTAFPNFDAVSVTLVHSVNLLAISTYQIINGQHTKKTAAFVRGCVAYCFITIPSITSITTQMDLYLLSAQVALVNHCLGQADASFEAAIKLINELPRGGDFDNKKTTENYLVQFTSNLLSTLIIVPDSPEQGVLYLVRMLLEAIKQYPFVSNGSNVSTIYINSLDMLTTAAQDSYPYHIPNLISNDELYGSDPKFLTEINIICSQIVDLILVELKSLGDSQQLKSQSLLSLDLFLRVMFSADVSVDKVQQLAINLWNLAMKNKNQVDDKLPGKILMKIESHKGMTSNQDVRHSLEKITAKMKMKM